MGSAITVLINMADSMGERAPHDAVVCLSLITNKAVFSR